MVEICRKADEEVVNQVITRAESGELKNFVEGKYESYGKIDVPAYSRKYSEAGQRTMPGTSVVDGIPPGELGPPDLLYTVDYLAKPVGTKEATGPPRLSDPGGHGFHRRKAEDAQRQGRSPRQAHQSHGRAVRHRQTEEELQEAAIDMVTLEGGFAASQVKEFPAGTFHVDMAQPAANTAFYCLEPQANDGFVGWDVLTDYLRSIGVDQRSIVYPDLQVFQDPGVSDPVQRKSWRLIR